MQTLDAYDVPKETAEKVLKLVMEDLKKILDADEQNKATTQKVDDLLSVEQTRTIYNRLGIISLAMANLYANEKFYSDAVETVARECVKLHDTITVLTQQNADLHKMLESKHEEAS